MNEPLVYAIAFARRGIPVLPLHRPVDGRCSCRNPNCPSPAKHPVAALAPHGLKNATTDERTIEDWFGAAPRNVGVLTGFPAGIVVLDVDPRHDGDTSLAALERQHGELPPTWRFLTGGGGEHVVFAHPGVAVPNSANKIGPGLDVRGEGGYIVAPPSVHMSGRRYAVSVDHAPDDVTLAPPPPWLLDRMLAGHALGQRRPGPDWREIAAHGPAEGARNTTLTSMAGLLLRRRIEPHLVLDLLQAWNAQRCAPPLDAAEVSTIVRSIASRELARRQAPARQA